MITTDNEAVVSSIGIIGLVIVACVFITNCEGPTKSTEIQNRLATECIQHGGSWVKVDNGYNCFMFGKPVENKSLEIQKSLDTQKTP